MTTSERIERALSVFDGKEQCPGCDGEGWTLEEGDDGDGYYATRSGCTLCDGEGWIIREPCIACGAPITQDIKEPQEHDEGCPVVPTIEEVQA